MGYNNIKNLIHALVNDYTTPHIEIESDLTDNLDEVYHNSSAAASKKNFWLNFLEYLHGENMPLKQSDLADTKSLGEFVSEFSDLDLSEDTTEEIYEHIKELLINGSQLSEKNDDKLFWNFSVNRLIYNVIDTYKKYNNGVSLKEDGVITWNNQEFDIKDITHADAGNAFDFNFDDNSIESELVVPWKNQEKQTFYSIMKDEFCVPINNKNKLQFTRIKDESHTEWIRLLMPQNNRRVEIIDLNRNFWVISMVLSEICMYLFGDDSPFIKLFKQIIDEIMQLWENVLYLWVALAMYCNTASSNIHIEFCPVPPSNQSHDRQYDYTEDVSSNISEIKERFQYLINKYPKRILIVIPYVRTDFSRVAEHKTIVFPFILWHFPFQEDYYYVSLHNANYVSSPIKVSTVCERNSTTYPGYIGIKDYIVGYRQIGSQIIIPNRSLAVIDKSYDFDIHQYKGIARIIPDVSFSIEEQNLKIKKFNLNFYDAVRQATGESATLALRVSTTNNTILNNGNTLNLTFSYGSSINSSDGYEETSFNDSSFYTGECLVNYVKNNKYSYDLSARAVSLFPLIEGEIREIPNIGNKITEDLNILKTFAVEDKTSISPDNKTLWFKLYTGEHDAGLNHWDDDTTPTYTWRQMTSSGGTEQVTKYLYIKDSQLHPRPVQIINPDYEIANHHTGNIGLCAVLSNPLARNEILTYPKYGHWTEHGNTAFPIKYTYSNGHSNYVYLFWHDYHFFLYRKLGNEEYNKNNWFVRYVQASGAYTLPFDSTRGDVVPNSSLPPDTSSALATSEQEFRRACRNSNNYIIIDKTTGVEYPIKPYIRTDGQERDISTLNYYPVTYKIDIHLFGPGNKYESATYRRREAVLNQFGPSPLRFYGDGDDISNWVLGEETTSGFGSLRKKLSEQYVLQLTEGEQTVYGTRYMPDFEASKRNGIVHTSKNGQTSDIESMDILPF